MPSQRVLLAEDWLRFERGTENNAANIALVEKQQPKKIKRKRAVQALDGASLFIYWIVCLLDCWAVCFVSSRMSS